jgi:hypothetical protein
MARDNRTLKLSILADIDDLKKKLDQADNTIQGSSTKISDFGKKAAAAFAVAGAAAGAFAISAIKNAIEDEASQRKLQETIRASTNATEAQTAAVAKYIDTTSRSIGVTDDVLRPSLARLIRSTNDTEKAQTLLNLALDITAATGKPLEAVSNALGKAYDGNSQALGRLGLGLDANILKSKDFDLVYQSLQGTFGNFAENEAQTLEKRFARLQIAVDEAKESIGAALLPEIEKLVNYLINVGIPALDGFIAGLIGDEGLSAALEDTQRGAESFGKTVASIIGIISGFITFLREAVGLVVELANTFIRFANIINPGPDTPYIPNPSSLDGYLRNPVPSVPSSTGLDRNPTARAGVVNNITVKAVDSEGAARAVAKVLTQSSARSIPALDGASIRKFQ